MQTQITPNLSIVVPLFNEEENVAQLVESIFRGVGESSGPIEVVLVDDGSVDATAALAAGLSERDGRVRLVRHGSNRGLGAAIRTGLRAAEGRLVLYTDADLPFDFSLIPGLIAQGGEARVVAGYRLNRGEGPRRWFLTKGYNLLIWLFFGLYMRDVNFACKIFPQRFLQNAELDSEGSFIDVEMLLESDRLGLEIIESPLTYYPRERGLSTLSRPAVIFHILREMYRYATKQALGQASFLQMLAASPLAKAIVLTAIAATSVVLMVEGASADRGEAWLSLILEAGIASVIFGWRLGLLASLLPFIGMETWLLWHGQPFFGRDNYYLLAWAAVGIPVSQISSGSWRLLQRSIRLGVPE